MTKELCQNIIRHTEDMMNEWISSDESGSLKQHENIHRLGRLTPSQRHAVTDLSLVDTLLTGDVNEEAEVTHMDDD